MCYWVSSGLEENKLSVLVSVFVQYSILSRLVLLTLTNNFRHYTRYYSVNMNATLDIYHLSSLHLLFQNAFLFLQNISCVMDSSVYYTLKNN